MNNEERYEAICKPLLVNVSTKVDEIHKVLFVGNGEPSIKAQLAQGKEKMANIQSFQRTLLACVGGLFLCIIGNVLSRLLGP